MSISGHYSYLSLRARTPSVERPGDGSNKSLRFPKSNLPSTKNLTLLIKSRDNNKPSPPSSDKYLPVEVVAVGGKPGKQPQAGAKSPVREVWPANYTYTTKINEV